MTPLQAAIAARTARMRTLTNNRMRLLEAKAAYRKRKKAEYGRDQKADLKHAKEEVGRG